MSEPVRIKLDRERTLRYDLNAMCILDEHGGVEQIDLASASGMRLMLYAGLRHEDEELTLAKVGSLVDMGRIVEIGEAIGRALNRDMPSTGQAPGKPKARPQRARKRA